MNIIGIIAEYDPFHNGHLYHINKIKEMYPDSLLILCLNGYFLQRGNVSLLSKEDKTKIALLYGVDIVIELPVLYGTQSADAFASAGVHLLHMMGVTHLVFGSESADVSYYKDLAEKQLKDDFKLLNEHKSLSYPALLALSLNEKNVIGPNDLLAISYTKAILRKHYDMQIVPIIRTSDYHDTTSTKDVVSASNIREKIKKDDPIQKYMPKESVQYLQTIHEDILFSLLKYRILDDAYLNRYIDVTEGMDNKLKKEINHVNNMEELIMAVKSKRYTYNRINRMLIHILLGIKKEDANKKIDYIHILGFNKQGQKYIKELQKTTKLPLAVNYQSPLYHYEILASQLYDLMTLDSAYEFELKNKPIIK